MGSAAFLKSRNKNNKDQPVRQKSCLVFVMQYIEASLSSAFAVVKIMITRIEENNKP